MHQENLIFFIRVISKHKSRPRKRFDILDSYHLNFEVPRNYGLVLRKRKKSQRENDSARSKDSCSFRFPVSRVSKASLASRFSQRSERYRKVVSTILLLGRITHEEFTSRGSNDKSNTTRNRKIQSIRSFGSIRG